MIKLDIDNIYINFKNNNNSYTLKYDKDLNEITITEIKEYNKVQVKNIILINNDNIEIYKERYYMDKLISIDYITNESKELFLNRIYKVFKNSNVTKDIIDIDKLISKVKNILIKNDKIALCNSSLNNIDNMIVYIIDILELETNKIIGSIKFNCDDININVDKKYLKQSLELLDKIIINKKDEKKLRLR